ncbi:MAG: hypothetical protein IIZ38_18305 [Sphingomonas sp.]|uniref:hypothetical protein n=1 Tax=Sphingomonas sp. TaxID=28214 RepID=UPI0025E94A64|nr:hypothetical protein [Sphingomonas sp.]MBQ1500264.1 hypothetical protein [Sphingomonas sp.]
MRLLQPIYCLVGKHHRSRSRAWNDGTAFRSWCEGCGRPMIREFEGWHLDVEASTGKRD